MQMIPGVVWSTFQQKARESGEGNRQKLLHSMMRLDVTSLLQRDTDTVDLLSLLHEF